ncbi:MAG: polysaccharide biosynthesis/export family protein [Pseudomonadota bacterium]
MSSTLSRTRRRVLFALGLGAGASLLGLNAAAAQDAQPASATPPINPNDTADNYLLGPGDQLKVTVFGETDLTGNYQVGSQGTISFPLVGEIEASGSTVPQFTDRLREALLTYIRAPNISVEVANYRPFFILGEVQRPGTYPYSANLTVQNAVATAGGFTYRANRGRAFIRHANESEEHAYRLSSSTPVLPGDTVRIGERFF